MSDAIDVVAANIARLRVERGLSQEEAAHRAGLGQASWSRIESGKSDDILLSSLQRVAAGLGVGVLDLLAGVDG